MRDLELWASAAASMAAGHGKESVSGNNTENAAGSAYQYPAEQTERLWKETLLNQFHDILPGSSIAEVYEVTKKEYAEIESRLAEMIAEKLNLLMDGGQDKISVFNTLGFDRNDVVSLGDCHAAALTDESGKIYPVQETAQGAVAYITDIPAKGGKTLQLLDTVKEEASRIQITENGIETPFYRISIDENGLFTSIMIKSVNVKY